MFVQNLQLEFFRIDDRLVALGGKKFKLAQRSLNKISYLNILYHVLFFVKIAIKFTWNFMLNLMIEFLISSRYSKQS